MNAKVKVATAASISAVVIAVVALTLAPAGASNYGWGGYNDDDFVATSKIRTSIEAKNYADVTTNQNQTAVSGDVVLVHNDDQDGSAGSGRAANTGTAAASVTASNKPVSLGSAATTVPVLDLAKVENLDSWDDVTLRSSVSTRVESKNDVDVTTNTNQTAVSGEVKVIHNDDVTGDATSGDAVNTASSSTSINLSN